MQREKINYVRTRKEGTQRGRELIGERAHARYLKVEVRDVGDASHDSILDFFFFVCPSLSTISLLQMHTHP